MEVAINSNKFKILTNLMILHLKGLFMLLEGEQMIIQELSYVKDTILKKILGLLLNLYNQPDQELQYVKLIKIIYMPFLEQILSKNLLLLLKSKIKIFIIIIL